MPFPTRLNGLGLYLHVPFCHELCPFCPYNRFVYRQHAFELYERAVCQEIDLYAPHLTGSTIGSLYVGGGTPSVNVSGLLRILKHLRIRLPPVSEICVELHPKYMDDSCLAALRGAGVNMVSVGVESTSDRLLRSIGRRHDADTAIAALQRAQAQGFETVNADLLFALPTETLAEWESDVHRVLNAGASQVSTYPLFQFPYSEQGRRQSLARVEQPAAESVRAMLEATDRIARGQGLHRCSVWSWIRGSCKKFSSVSRHHYLGFGPSASSMIGSHFYVNTFQVDAYTSALPARRPIALSMRMDRRLQMAYWLYWRAYELFAGNDQFHDLFGLDQSIDNHFGAALVPFRLTGLLQRTAQGYRLTHEGAYWIHRIQNHCSLSYINRLWGACRDTPWPEEVIL